MSLPSRIVFMGTPEFAVPSLEAILQAGHDVPLVGRNAYDFIIESDRAIAEWNRGDLDALVPSREKAPALMRELQAAVLSQLKSKEQKET